LFGSSSSWSADGTLSFTPRRRLLLPLRRRDIQQRVFSTIGLSEEEARAKFGYLLDCFETGAPPHGGKWGWGHQGWGLS
jgi:hypothetical protein